MNETLLLPAIGSTVTVFNEGSFFLTGRVTEHDTKDGMPVITYEYPYTMPDGRVVQASRWAWLHQVVNQDHATPYD